VYLPISTGQRIYSKNDNRINNLAFTTGDLKAEETKIIEESLRQEFSKRHKFNIEDKRAIWIRNNVEQFEQFLKLFNGISLFVWIIGIFTLIAGVVGVSNIMIITVKERTKEIGVRKAIGATPGSIVGLVLLEALIIMGIAGYIGLVSGIGLLEFLSPKFADSGTFFKNPGVDIGIAMYATTLLIICGLIAGFFPARRASKIKPVTALRDE
jgi:putative ABC transport system permease protein